MLKGKWTEQFDEVWVSAEIFNLLQARNTVSYLWVRDVSAAGQYAVPNYMTNRLINFKMHVDYENSRELEHETIQNDHLRHGALARRGI